MPSSSLHQYFWHFAPSTLYCSYDFQWFLSVWLHICEFPRWTKLCTKWTQDTHGWSLEFQEQEVMFQSCHSSNVTSFKYIIFICFQTHEQHRFQIAERTWLTALRHVNLTWGLNYWLNNVWQVIGSPGCDIVCTSYLFFSSSGLTVCVAAVVNFDNRHSGLGPLSDSHHMISLCLFFPC